MAVSVPFIRHIMVMPMGMGDRMSMRRTVMRMRKPTALSDTGSTASPAGKQTRGNAPCAIVLKSPAYGSEYNKHGSIGKPQAVRSLKRQDDTGQRDQHDRDPQPL